MAFGKKNVIKIDPAYYSLMLLGESKAGKSTLIKEYCEKIVGEDGYLFIETGAERGADAINGINYINAPEWHMDYDEYTNSAGFADICEDIIENKNSDYKDLRIVVWDTLDQLIDIAEAESIRLYNKEAIASGKSKVTSVNAAWGGFGRGEKKAIELMLNMRAKLLNVGVQTIIISHVKRKDITDVITGDSYQVLTSDQQQNYFNAFKKDMHFLALAYIDRELVKEKKKNGRNGETTNKVVGETRRIKFRDDNYAIDSGSRFAEIKPDIPMDVDSFIKAITDAIQAEASKGNKSVAELKKEQDKENKAHEKAIAEAEKTRKEEEAAEANLQDIIAQIQAYFDANKKDNLAGLKPIAAAIKEMGYTNPSAIDDIDNAKTILEMCK